MKKIKETTDSDENPEEIENPFRYRQMTPEERDEIFHESKRGLMTPEKRDEILGKPKKHCTEYSSRIDKTETQRESKVEKDEVSSETEMDIVGEVSIDAEPFKEVENERREIDLEEVRRLYCVEKMSLLKIGEYYGYSSGAPIKRALENEGIEIRPSGFQKIEIDPDEVYRLYFVEGKALNKVADHFECKSTDPILRVFDEEGWKTRYQETYETAIDPEEVFRLYNEEGFSIRKIGAHYGVSYGPILRVFKEHNMEYGQKIMIDPDIIYHLYFERGLPKDDVTEQLGVSKKVFDRILKEEGWEARPAGFQKVDIDCNEFKRLYYEEDLPLDEMAEHFEVSVSTIIRYRQENNLENRPSKLESIHSDKFMQLYYVERLPFDDIANQLGVTESMVRRYIRIKNLEKRTSKIESLLLEKFQKLYYEEKLSIREMAKCLEVSRASIRAFIKTHNLEIRPHKYDLISSRIFNKLFYDEKLQVEEIAKQLEVPERIIENYIRAQDLEKRRLKPIKEIQDLLFGTECVSCGRPRGHIHKKDGVPHGTKVLWTKKSLITLEPNDWVALCIPCHRLTHSLMKSFGCQWNDIDEILKELARKWLS